MKTQIRRVGRVLVFEFEGGLDRGDLPALETGFEEALRAEKPLVVVDLAAATFLSSSALGLFVRIRKAAKAKGGDLVLAKPSAFIVDVVRTLGLDRVFTIHAKTDDALAALAGL